MTAQGCQCVSDSNDLPVWPFLTSWLCSISVLPCGVMGLEAPHQYNLCKDTDNLFVLILLCHAKCVVRVGQSAWPISDGVKGTLVGGVNSVDHIIYPTYDTVSWMDEGPPFLILRAQSWADKHSVEVLPWHVGYVEHLLILNAVFRQTYIMPPRAAIIDVNGEERWEIMMTYPFCQEHEHS